MVPFQVEVKVVDARGVPVAGATVRLRLGPGTHPKTVLMDGTGTQCPEVEGTTDANGRALIWVRLLARTGMVNYNHQPYDVCLTAEMPASQTSNLFKVYDLSDAHGPSEGP
jgi:hypothetical protein